MHELELLWQRDAGLGHFVGDEALLLVHGDEALLDFDA